MQKFNTGQLDDLIQVAIRTAVETGKIILSFYAKEIETVSKTDGSPLTLADKASHDFIVHELAITNLPVVSEEGNEPSAIENHYWLVDPLDGTKDFLATNDEFTVNIALMESNRPIMGVVYAPALGELYAGIVGKGAWKVKENVKTFSQQVSRSKTLKMATSRFHDHIDAENFAKANHISQQIAVGSALKYGRLAFGEIDVYPRLVGTSEWDTAAGQAVLESAGGKVLDWHTGEPMIYGKLNRRNGRFIAMRSPYTFEEFTYQQFLQKQI